VAWVEIVVAVLGSSLIGILLTNFAIDYNQPKIRMNVIEDPVKIPGQKRYDTTILNEGNAAATNLRITLHYLSGNITNYRIVYSDEYSTSFINPKLQSALITNVSRFAPSGIILIHTTVNDSKTPKFVGRNEIEYTGGYKPYNGEYLVSAVYNQGGALLTSQNISLSEYSPESLLPERIIPLSTLLFLGFGIAGTILLSILGYIAIHKKLVEQPGRGAPIVRRTPARVSLLLLIEADGVLIFLFWYLFTIL
jgi:hypothetical protein